MPSSSRLDDNTNCDSNRRVYNKDPANGTCSSCGFLY